MPEYYLLDQEHKKPFLPYLNAEDREDPSLEVLGAAADGAAAGALAFVPAGEGDIEIRSLAVAENRRKQGLGSGLAKELARIMPELGFRRAYATVVECVDHLPAMEALLDAGFRLEEGMPVAECPLSALLASPVMKPFLEKEGKDVTPLGDVPEGALRKLNRELLDGGYLRAPLDWSRFSPALSFCGMPKGGEIAGCVCLHAWEGGVYVDWAYARPKASRTLMAVLAAALKAAAGRYGPDGLCSAVLASDAGASLMEKLGGDAVKRTNTLRCVLEL